MVAVQKTSKMVTKTAIERYICEIVIVSPTVAKSFLEQTSRRKAMSKTGYGELKPINKPQSRSRYLLVGVFFVVVVLVAGVGCCLRQPDTDHTSSEELPDNTIWDERVSSNKDIYFDRRVEDEPLRCQVHWPKMFLYGDSITEKAFSEDGCWGTLLANKLIRKCDVINRGFGGYNTRWNLIMLPRLFTPEVSRGTVAFTIFLGTNDSDMEEINPRPHVPVDEYKANLIKMVTFLQTVGVQRKSIIFLSPPPSDEKRERNRTNKILALYVKACQEAAEESGVAFVDFFHTMLKQKNWKEFLVDGTHFTKIGAEFAFNLLWPEVESRTAHLPEVMPANTDIDYKHPERSLGCNTTSTREYDENFIPRL